MSPEVWMAAAETAPLAHVGGLGDVLRALPPALARRGLRVRRVLPAYGSVDRRGFEDEGIDLKVPLGGVAAGVRCLTRDDGGGLRTTLIACDELFGRDGIYGSGAGEFPDNARRFTLFARAVCELARRAPAVPDVLHVHDWHAALVPLLVRFVGPWERAPRTVLTIHNMGYQGRFAAGEMRWLALDAGLRDHLYRPDGIEFYGDINFLKAGLLYADRITAVSPTYAREIQTAAAGFGLQGVVRRRAADLTGILNGADYTIWNPSTDRHLPRPFDTASIEAREEACRALRRHLRLPDGARPVVGVVSRLAHQKGIDVLAAAGPALFELGADLAVLGSGEADTERVLQALQRSHPDRVGLRLGYDETLSHLIVAGSDLLAVPSRYEPCGLVQMHAMRYGTLPVVHRTGGLADTVRDAGEFPGRGTGFVFDTLTPASLAGAVRRALALRADAEAWRALQRRAMAEDFSWAVAAARYSDLYLDLLGRV
jgi:starch synthase